MSVRHERDGQTAQDTQVAYLVSLGFRVRGETYRGRVSMVRFSRKRGHEYVTVGPRGGVHEDYTCYARGENRYLPGLRAQAGWQPDTHTLEG